MRKNTANARRKQVNFGFCTKSDEFCMQNDGFCTKSDEFCTENDGCLRRRASEGLRHEVMNLPLKMTNFVLQMMNLALKVMDFVLKLMNLS